MLISQLNDTDEKVEDVPQDITVDGDRNVQKTYQTKAATSIKRFTSKLGQFDRL